MDNKYWRKEDSDAPASPDCSNHKKDIAGISDMRVLAEMIGDLHYQTLTELLSGLEKKLYEDGVRDRNAGKLQLAVKLQEASMYISRAEMAIGEAWQISKPFMKDHDQ